MRDENIQTGVRDVNFTFRWYRPVPCNSWPSINVVEMRYVVDSEGAVDDSIESTPFAIITFFSPPPSNKIKISKTMSPFPFRMLSISGRIHYRMITYTFPFRRLKSIYIDPWRSVIENLIGRTYDSQYRVENAIVLPRSRFSSFNFYWLLLERISSVFLRRLRRQQQRLIRIFFLSWRHFSFDAFHASLFTFRLSFSLVGSNASTAVSEFSSFGSNFLAV